MKRYIPAAVGVIIFLYVLWWVGTRNVLNAFRNVSLTYFLASAALMGLSYSIKFMRWAILVRGRPQYKAIALSKLFPVFAVNYGLSVSLPSKTGDVAGLEVSRRYVGIPIGDGASFVAFYRIFDVTIVLIMAAGSSLTVSEVIKIEWLKPALVLCTIILILLFFLFLYPSTSEKMAELLLRGLNTILKGQAMKLRQGIHKNIDDYLGVIRAYSQKKISLLAVAGLTGVRWLLEFTAFKLLLRSVGVEASFGFTMFIVTSRVIIAVLALVPFGFGTTLVPTIAVLNVLGVSLAAGVAVDVLSNLLGPVLVALVGIICTISLREHNLSPSKPN